MEGLPARQFDRIHAPQSWPSEGFVQQAGRAFFQALHDGCVKHGVCVIERVRQEDPTADRKTVASLMPWPEAQPRVRRLDAALCSGSQRSYGVLRPLCDQQATRLARWPWHRA